MCTIITREQSKKPDVATENITVYKFGRKTRVGNFVSPYLDYMYQQDIIKSTKMTYSDYDGNGASDTVESLWAYANIPIENKIWVMEGFHAFTTLNRILDHYPAYKTIAEFIIPQGALYHRNGADNIVSNQIVFKKFIN